MGPGPFSTGKKTSHTEAAPRAVSPGGCFVKSPLIRKNEKKSPVFKVAALFGWFVCRCPSHLRVDPSPFTLCIYSSFTAWRERKTHHVQGFDWKILRRYSDPFTLLVQRRQTKFLGEKKTPIKDLS